MGRRVMNHTGVSRRPARALSIHVRWRKDRSVERQRGNRWKDPQMVRLPYFSTSKGSFVFTVVRGNSFPAGERPFSSSYLMQHASWKEFLPLFSVPRDCRPTFDVCCGKTDKNYSSAKERCKGSFSSIPVIEHPSSYPLRIATVGRM